MSHPSTQYSNRYSLWADEHEPIFQEVYRQSNGGMLFSKSFLQTAAWATENWAYAKLNRRFTRRFGVGMSGGIYYHFESGVVSKLSVITGVRYISVYHGCLCWRSHSGRIWLPSDEVDPDDIEFWLEGFDWDLIRTQLAEKKKVKSTFRIPKLSFVLDVQQLAVDAEWTIELKPGVDRAAFEHQLGEWINEFNRLAEAGKWKDAGVVHNCRFKAQKEEGEPVVAYVDTGSGGDRFYRYLLPLISELDQVERMTIS